MSESDPLGLQGYVNLPGGETSAMEAQALSVQQDMDRVARNASLPLSTALQISVNIPTRLRVGPIPVIVALKYKVVDTGELCSIGLGPWERPYWQYSSGPGYS
jgi:hypothetical protein